MKKIRVLALVMIFAFAALGGAYAMWYDSLNLYTAINTGLVDVCWQNVKSSDDGGYYAEMPGGAGQNVFQGNLDSMDSGNPNGGELKNVASLNYQLADDSEWSDFRTVNDQLSITLKNAYPGYQESIEADIVNVGSVPVKFRVIEKDVPEWVVVQVDLHSNESGEAQEWTALEGYQLDPGAIVHATITYRIKQTAEQGKQVSFTLQLKGIQWNEYSPDESYVLPYSIQTDRIGD
ncbi:MAG: hypothetical protein ABFD04_01520 [Syntrophomonas sp.]